MIVEDMVEAEAVVVTMTEAMEGKLDESEN
jgi:hypothetical protein